VNNIVQNNQYNDCNIPFEKGRIGFFGGTFDPIHNGHLMIVEEALAAADLDGVMIVPSGVPALKWLGQVSMTAYRYGMALKATKKKDKIRLSDIELCLSGPSYTLSTMKELNKKLGDKGEVFLIGGSDILFDLPRWHRPEELLQECKLLIGTRPGYTEKEVVDQAELLKSNYGARIQLFEMPPQNISSTEIRHSILTGDLANIPTPKKVRKFIKKYDVYGDRVYLEKLRQETLINLFHFQQLMWHRMGFNRLLHSVSTAMTALRMAARFGADLDKTVVAAMLHDICKEQPAPELLQGVSKADAWWTGFPAVVHGPEGAAYVQQQLNIDDPVIIDAISYHTILRPNANIVEKIVFLSDKIEPGRKYMDLGPIRKAAESDLDKAVYLCVKAVNQVLFKSGQKPHPYSVKAERRLAF
jgi:nicotinate-nucleotide adenylyltransferase